MDRISSGSKQDVGTFHISEGFIHKEMRMLLNSKFSLITGLMVVAVVIASSLLITAGVPTGWHLAGSKPADYESGIDKQAQYNAHPSAYLKSKTEVIDGFGTLMQNFRADQYAGKRMRFTAFLKSEGVQDWAGLWMRVDKGKESVAFDNMQDRPIRGSNGWREYAVVLDVPQNATGIFFGVLLSGSGEVWMNSVKVKPVGSEVPTTGSGATQNRDHPINLDFEN